MLLTILPCSMSMLLLSVVITPLQPSSAFTTPARNLRASNQTTRDAGYAYCVVNSNGFGNRHKEFVACAAVAKTLALRLVLRPLPVSAFHERRVAASLTASMDVRLALCCLNLHDEPLCSILCIRWGMSPIVLTCRACYPSASPPCTATSTPLQP